MRVFMIFFLSFGFSLASMNLDSSKRLVAKIGKDSINRISIENDRIAQVFGDAETFELQTEEGTGQIFLKPTQENGTKPLSITLITENGITQDLKLIPFFDTASSLVLRGSVSQKTHTVPDSIKENSTIAFQEKLIQAMKILITGYAPQLEEFSPERSAPLDFTLSFRGCFQVGAFKGYKFRLENKTDSFVTLSEKNFFRQGDKAISFEKKSLKAKQSTFLYVVA